LLELQVGEDPGGGHVLVLRLELDAELGQGVVQMGTPIPMNTSPCHRCQAAPGLAESATTLTASRGTGRTSSWLPPGVSALHHVGKGAANPVNAD
jgi:hypothetical protein